MCLSDLEVSSGPLLQQGREQSRGKTYRQAQEPKRVHPNGIGGWRKWWWGGREGTRNIGPIWVGETLINAREVEVRGVLWVLPNVLN